MPAPKKLTIGVSVNLQRYENLRLAVEGEVTTDEDAEDLALYLDRVLARFGRNDPETATQIDRYRQRVMPVSGAGGEPEPAPASSSGPPCGEPADATPAVTSGTGFSPVLSPGPVAAPGFLYRREGSGAEAGGEGDSGGGTVHVPAPPVSAEPAPVPPAGPPAAPAGAGEGPMPPAAEDHGRCEVCGAALSRQEAKLSRIFVERLLCKKCLDALQDERACGG
jgi:hypothetical protein